MFEQLNPHFRPIAQAFYNEASRRGWHPVVTSVYRSMAKQKQLYRRYLRGHSIYPAAPPGQSLHNYGLAFDAVMDTEEHQQQALKLWQSWGGNLVANDPVHFEPRH